MDNLTETLNRLVDVQSEISKQLEEIKNAITKIQISVRDINNKTGKDQGGYYD